ncbi:hypothetical protein NPIL_636221, partial [Nephila pilipes]
LAVTEWTNLEQFFSCFCCDFLFISDSGQRHIRTQCPSDSVAFDPVYWLSTFHHMDLVIDSFNCGWGLREFISWPIAPEAYLWVR